MVVAVEHLAGHLRRGDQRQGGDLCPDLFERALRLGLDLALGLLEPPLAVGLCLLLDPLALGVGDAPSLGEDLLGLALRLPDQGAVLLEQLASLVAGAVGLLDRHADLLAAVVDRLLDRAEGVLPEHEERDREGDQRPDHQAGNDLDQGVRGYEQCAEHQMST